MINFLFQDHEKLTCKISHVHDDDCNYNKIEEAQNICQLKLMCFWCSRDYIISFCALRHVKQINYEFVTHFDVSEMLWFVNFHAKGFTNNQAFDLTGSLLWIMPS